MINYYTFLHSTVAETRRKMWIFVTVHSPSIKHVTKSTFLKRKCVTEVEKLWISLPSLAETLRDRNFYESDILKSQKRQPCSHKHIMHSKRLVWTRNQRCVANQIKREAFRTRVTHSLNVSFTFFSVFHFITYEGESSPMIVNVEMHSHRQRPSYLQPELRPLTFLLVNWKPRDQKLPKQEKV